MVINPFTLTKITEHMCNGDLCLLHSQDERVRNHDVHYPFRANSNFKYICSLNETKCVLVIQKKERKCKISLFKPPFNAQEAQWSTARSSFDVISQDNHLAKVGDLTELEQYLKHLAKDINRIYCDENDNFITQYNSIFNHLDIININEVMGKCRLIKTEEEILKIKKAIDLSHQGHILAMQNSYPGANEAWISQQVLLPAAEEGLDEWAYPPIVAGAERACVLHYNQNNQYVKSGELVLIDAGIEYDGYASDITRTFPINGTFNPYQLALYEVVLNAQDTAIKNISRTSTFQDITHLARVTMLQNLIDIKFIDGSVEEHLERDTLSQYFYHGLGHWMGLDVHDPCPYKNNNEPITFMPGMVFTIEPGIYIRPGSTVDEKWHGIGIRIEDNILMGEQSPIVLSEQIPKKPKEVEEICQK